MDLDKLNSVYDEILGKGEAIATAEPGSDTPAKGDTAYQDPDYSGEGGDDDGIDPRDPSTMPDDGPDDDDDIDGEPEGEPEETEEYEDIPDELVAAGRQAGLTDEEIIDLDAEKPAVLVALAKAMKAKGPEPAVRAQAEPSKQEPERKPESLELKFDLPGLDDELSQVAGPVQEAFNKLLSRVTHLESGLNKAQESVADVEKTRQAEMFRQVDVFFDNQAEQLPELGNTSELNQAAVDARIYAWNIANDLMTANKSLGLQDALVIGVNALRGQVSESKLKARVVSDLNKRKAKFSPRPRGSRRGGDKPKTEEERALAAIDEVLGDPKYQ